MTFQHIFLAYLILYSVGCLWSVKTLYEFDILLIDPKITKVIFLIICLVNVTQVLTAVLFGQYLLEQYFRARLLILTQVVKFKVDRMARRQRVLERLDL